MRRRRSPAGVHLPGLFHRLLERIRGWEQRLVRGSGEHPLLLLSYPRGKEEAAREVEIAYTHTLPALGAETVAPYAKVLAALPVMVVVLLRPVNPCGCLGHHHPAGIESRLTRRLAAELGSNVGEIDLAYEAIRDWRPQPLSSLAAGDLGESLEALHFQAALLAVLLHELEHLAFPEKKERAIRGASNEFYSEVMRELVAREGGTGYGMAGPPPRP